MAEGMRGGVPFEESEKDVKEPGSGKPGEKLDWRSAEYRRNMPKLSERHEEIKKKILDGVTKRVIHMELGVSRSTLERYIADHEDLKEAWADAQEDLLDLNEEVINEIATMDCRMAETENGNFPIVDGRSLATKFNAAKLRLERLGGKRGWNAKLETNEVGAGRVPVIYCGKVSEAEISEAEAAVEAANRDAMKGLEGIPRG